MNKYPRTTLQNTIIPTARPSEAGVPEEAVCEFLTHLQTTGVPMHAVLLARHGKLIAEGYYAPFERNRLHRMFSVTKSLNALAIGLLEADGKLSLDDPIINYFPDKLPDNIHPFVSSMTIRNLLMMRTCHVSTTYKGSSLEWVESFFKTPPSHKPGTVFHYDTSAAHTLCILVERVAGMPMLDFLKERVLSKIGWSAESYILPNPYGDAQGGSGLMCTAYDLLLLGQLLLQRGNWNGEQLLPKAFVEAATSKLSPTIMTGPVLSEMQGYGYQIWRGEHNNFVLYGMGGQLVICLPDYDMVCVTCADTQGMGGGNQFIYNRFYETILPAIDAYPSGCYPKPLSEEGVTAYDQLQEQLSSLCIQPVRSITAHVDPDTTCQPQINGRTYHLTENKHGYTHCSLHFDESSTSGYFAYSYAGNNCRLTFDTQTLQTGILDVHDLFYCASGTWTSTDTFYLLCHIIDTSVGSISMEFVFGDQDVTIFMKKIEETYLDEYNCHLYGRLLH